MAAGGSDSDRRRAKAALFLACCGLVGIAPHWLPPGRSLVPAITLATLLGGYSLRTVLLQAFRRGSNDTPQPDLSSSAVGSAALPSAVDVVVAARDEQAVIARLVERIAALRWPEGQLTLWVVDDGSDDRTPELLAELQGSHPFLRVLRRSREAGGGKSGALNLVLHQLSGRWMLVLDADADLQSDVLERLVPWAEAGGWAAVQLRKAVANAQTNLLTTAQAMEMAFDAMIQEGRLANGWVA